MAICHSSMLSLVVLSICRLPAAQHQCQADQRSGVEMITAILSRHRLPFATLHSRCKHTHWTEWHAEESGVPIFKFETMWAEFSAKIWMQNHKQSCKVLKFLPEDHAPAEQLQRSRFPWLCSRVCVARTFQCSEVEGAMGCLYWPPAPDHLSPSLCHPLHCLCSEQTKQKHFLVMADSSCASLSNQSPLNLLTADQTSVDIRSAVLTQISGKYRYVCLFFLFLQHLEDTCRGRKKRFNICAL